MCKKLSEDQESKFQHDCTFLTFLRCHGSLFVFIIDKEHKATTFSVILTLLIHTQQEIFHLMKFLSIITT